VCCSVLLLRFLDELQNAKIGEVTIWAKSPIRLTIETHNCSSSLFRAQRKIENLISIQILQQDPSRPEGHGSSKVEQSRRRTHDEVALMGTLSLASCTDVGLAAAVLLPPRVARNAPPKAVESVPSARYSFLIARPNTTLLMRPINRRRIEREPSHHRNLVSSRFDTSSRWEYETKELQIGRKKISVNNFGLQKEGREDALRHGSGRVDGRCWEFRDESCHPGVSVFATSGSARLSVQRC